MIQDFLLAILGPTGSQALMKAVQKKPVLESVLIPRALVSWLNLAIRPSYEGSIPGFVNSYLRLDKSEEQYSGAVTVGDYTHVFEANNVLHIAAAISVSMGVEQFPEDISPKELSDLGRSLDLLVKARAAIDQGVDLHKVMTLPPTSEQQIGGRYLFGHKNTAIHQKTIPLGESGMFHHIYVAPHDSTGFFHHLSYSDNPNMGSVAQIHGVKEGGQPFEVGYSQVHPEHKGKGLGKLLYQQVLNHHGSMASDTDVSGSAQRVWQHLAQTPGVQMQWGAPGTRERHVATMTKVELPGQEAKPIKPKEFGGPQAPIVPTAGGKKVAKRELRLSLKDLQSVCGDCGGRQFRDSTFTGCTCFKELAKSVCVLSRADGQFLEFGSGLDGDEVLALVAALKS